MTMKNAMFASLAAALLAVALVAAAADTAPAADPFDFQDEDSSVAEVAEANAVAEAENSGKKATSSLSEVLSAALDEDDEAAAADDEYGKPSANAIKDADSRIQARFDANDFHYKITESGNYTAIMDCGNDRTQLVVICSVTEELDDMEIREVISLGYRGNLARSQLVELMQDSSTKKIGAWQLEGDDDVVFVAKVPADLDFDSLSSVIWAVAKSADAAEENLLGSDDF